MITTDDGGDYVCLRETILERPVLNREVMTTIITLSYVCQLHSLTERTIYMSPATKYDYSDAITTNVTEVISIIIIVVIFNIIIVTII